MGVVLQRDLDDVKQFASSRGFTEDPLWWDVAFWAERLREDKYDLKDEELRPYFALPEVLGGLFKASNDRLCVSLVLRVCLLVKLVGIELVPCDDLRDVLPNDVQQIV